MLCSAFSLDLGTILYTPRVLGCDVGPVVCGSSWLTIKVNAQIGLHDHPLEGAD